MLISRKPKSEAKSWRAITKHVPIETNEFDTTIGGFKSVITPYYLHYAIRLKMEAGYFQNINELLGLIKIRIKYLTENVKKFEVPKPNINPEATDHLINVDKQNHYNKFLYGWNSLDEWYIGYRKDITSNDTILNRIKYVMGQKKIHVDPQENQSETIVILKIQEATSKLFGWPLKQDITFYPNQYFESPNQCRINPFGQLILCYCDIIENPVVKNNYMNLLKVLCLSDKNLKFGHLFNKEYKHPSYFPLNVRHLSSMNIHLRDLTGQKIKFENTSSPVMFTFHFRPITRNFTI